MIGVPVFGDALPAAGFFGEALPAGGFPPLDLDRVLAISAQRFVEKSADGGRHDIDSQ